MYYTKLIIIFFLFLSLYYSVIVMFVHNYYAHFCVIFKLKKNVFVYV